MSEMVAQGCSVIVPFLNEEDGISGFCKSIDEFAGRLEFPIELVFVDDGSSDDTFASISNFGFVNVKNAKVVRFTRNYGVHAAFCAGFRNAGFDICTWVSVDMQEPLDMIPLAYEKITAGQAEVVYIEKEEIIVNPVSRAFSKMYYYLMKNYAISSYPKMGIGAAVFGQKVKDYLIQNVASNAPIVLQLLDAGFRSCSIPMPFSARTTGRSKWTLSKKIKTLIDSFVLFSYAPIRLVSMVGILIFLIGLVVGIVTVCNRIDNPDVPVGYSTIVSVLALGFGITNISLGIIAEYLWRTFDAARNRSYFIISDIVALKCGIGEEQPG